MTKEYDLPRRIVVTLDDLDIEFTDHHLASVMDDIAESVQAYRGKPLTDDEFALIMGEFFVWLKRLHQNGVPA